MGLIWPEKCTLKRLTWSQGWPIDTAVLGNNPKREGAGFVCRNVTAEWVWNVNKQAVLRGVIVFRGLFHPFAPVLPSLHFVECDLEMMCVKYRTQSPKPEASFELSQINYSCIQQNLNYWSKDFVTQLSSEGFALQRRFNRKESVVALLCVALECMETGKKLIQAISGLLLSCHFTLYT